MKTYNSLQMYYKAQLIIGWLVYFLKIELKWNFSKIKKLLTRMFAVEMLQIVIMYLVLVN
jgi:hypothetical protein